MIHDSNLGLEDERMAILYLIDAIPQVEIDVSDDLKIREHEEEIAGLLACHIDKDIDRVARRIEKV